MRKLLRFISLPSSDRMLLLRAAFMLTAIRLGLYLLPFKTLRRILERTGRPRRQRAAPSVEQVVRAVASASRYIPAAGSCLTRALAAQVLLLRNGHPASFHIGVTLNGGRRLDAHAWVESGGRIVIGETPELRHYTPLLRLEGERS